MALIIRSIVGFELGPAVPASGVTYGYLARAADNGYVAGDIVSGAKRSGNYGYNSKATVSADALNATVVLTPNGSSLPAASAWEMRVRYFFRIVALPSASNLHISFTGTGVGAFVVRIQMDTSGSLRVVPALVGSTTTSYQGTFATDTWYQVRLRCFGTGSTGVAGGGKNSSYELGIYSEDGVTLITSFSDTVPDGNNMPSVWPEVFAMGQIAGGTSCTREIHYDDYWCHLATGSDVASMEWPIGTTVNVFAPVANGATNDFARGGVDTGANWSQVSDIPLLTGGLTTTVTSATGGAIDLYQHGGLVDPSDVVYLIQSVARVLDTTTPQQLLIDGVASNIETVDGASSRYGLAWSVYTNDAPLLGTDFDDFEFGIKKLTAGGTTMTCSQNFLEVLTGPARIIEVDLPPDPDPGGLNGFNVSAKFGEEPDAPIVPGFLYTEDTSMATGVLGFRLGNQGAEINVPTTWRVNRVDVGYRDEETS